MNNIYKHKINKNKKDLRLRVEGLRGKIHAKTRDIQKLRYQTINWLVIPKIIETLKEIQIDE